MVTDFNFADDIALVSDIAERAAKLHEVEHHCRRIGQQLNAKKTELMAYNTENTEVSTFDGKKLKVFAEFKNLGSMITSSAKDIKKRRALAWSALHKIKRVWESGMDWDLKRRLFVSTVECVLTYGYEWWALSVKEKRALDGVYTRILRMALNVSWQDHMRNVD